MVIGKTVYHIFSVYAPQVGRSEDEKVEVWEGLEDKVVGVPRSEGRIDTTNAKLQKFQQVDQRNYVK